MLKRFKKLLDLEPLGENLHNYIRHNPDKLVESRADHLDSPDHYWETHYPDQPGRLPSSHSYYRQPTTEKLESFVVDNTIRFFEPIVAGAAEAIKPLIPDYEPIILPGKPTYYSKLVPSPAMNKNGKNGNGTKVGKRKKPRRRRNIKRRPRPRLMGPGIRSVAAPVARASVINSNLMDSPYVVISKREFVLNIQSNTGNYDVDTFNINPGLPDVFPWLANVASAWDKYKFLYLAFEYRNSCSTAEPGRVLITFEPNTAASAPTSKLQQLQSPYHVVTVPWTAGSCIVPVPIMNQGGSNGWYLTRNATTTQSLGLYDVGLLHLGTEGVSTNSLGELWVAYKVVLSQQQANPAPVSFKATVTSSPTELFVSNYVATGDTSHFSFVLPAPSNTFQITRSGQFYMTWYATGYTTLSAMSVVLTTGSGSVTTRDAAIFNGAATAGYISCSIVVSSVNPDIPFVMTFAFTAVGGGSNVIRISGYSSALT